MTYSLAPVLNTQRLVLRPYREDDFPAFADYFTSERSVFTDGPVSRAVAWDLFTAGAGRWVISGHGAWAVERQSDKTCIGLVSLNTAIEMPEPELGWILWDGFEGHGYAFEAAIRAKAFALETLNWPHLVSGVHEKNDRSIALALRLGATIDPDLKLKDEPETLFFRHTA